MWWVVDRVEGRFAVLVSDAGEERTVPRGGFREGRVYWWNGRKLTRNAAEERRRKAALRVRLDTLARTDPGGDIVL